MNPGDGFTFNFNSFTPNSNSSITTSSTVLEISNGTDTVLLYGVILASSATSFFLPANTLQPNTPYFLQLVFSNGTSSTAGGNGILQVQNFQLRDDVAFTTGAVPEPGTVVLLVVGIFAGAWRRRSVDLRRDSMRASPRYPAARPGDDPRSNVS
jgi:hypothetical protein